MNQLDELKRLGELRTKGILSEEEFATQKARVLGVLPPPPVAPKIEAPEPVAPPPPVSQKKETPEPIATPPPPEMDKYSDLDRLIDFKKRGILSDEEFAREKATILGIPYIPIKSQAEKQAEAAAEEARKSNEILAQKLKEEEQKRQEEAELRRLAEQERNLLLTQLEEKQLEEKQLEEKQRAETLLLQQEDTAKQDNVKQDNVKKDNVNEDNVNEDVAASYIEIIYPEEDKNTSLPMANNFTINATPLTLTNKPVWYKRTSFLVSVAVLLIGLLGGLYYYFLPNTPVSKNAANPIDTTIVTTPIDSTKGYLSSLSTQVNAYAKGKKLSKEKKMKIDILIDDIAYAQKNQAINTPEKNKLNYQTYLKEFDEIKK